MAVVYQLKKKYDQDKLGAVPSEAFDTISFPLEDKHVVNEHHIIRKSNDTIQKKCPHMVHFNKPHDWFETNLRLQKRGKKRDSWVSRSTGKSSTSAKLKKQQTYRKYFFTQQQYSSVFLLEGAEHGGLFKIGVHNGCPLDHASDLLLTNYAICI